MNMSEYNCNCSADIESITENEEAWLKAAFSLLTLAPWETAEFDAEDRPIFSDLMEDRRELATQLFDSIEDLMEEGHTYWGFEHGMGVVDGGKLCTIYAEDPAPNVDGLLSFLKLFLEKNRPDGHVVVEWSWQEEVAGGGGAAVVTAKNIYTTETSTWIEGILGELGKG